MDSPWHACRLSPGRGPRVAFGRMYEDHGVELAAFPPRSRVLAIASAGDTAAALARAGHEVTAVDVNPAQLAYARARHAGAPAVAGSAERLLAAGRAAAGVSRGWRPAALTRFLAMTDPAAQLAHWRGELDTPALRALMAAGLRPAGALAAFLRPGFRAVVPPRFDAVLRERIAACVGRYPNAANPWLWRLLLGADPPDAGDRGPAAVTWLLADVAAHLESVRPGRYDAVTLSNVLDGPPPAYADRLARALRHAVRPGGVVVLRSVADTVPLPGRYVADRCPLWGAVAVTEIGARS